MSDKFPPRNSDFELERPSAPWHDASTAGTTLDDLVDAIPPGDPEDPRTPPMPP